MKQIEKDIVALEQARKEPTPEPEPENMEALAEFYAIRQHDFAKAAEAAGIIENAAKRRWGADYLALTKAVEKQRRDCLAYCETQNTRPTTTTEEPKEQLPPDLQHLPQELRFDKRRWNELQRQKGRRKRRHGRGR